MIFSVICEELGDCSFAALSGPSHAEEIARLVPTAVVVASESLSVAEKIQDILNSQKFLT